MSATLATAENFLKPKKRVLQINEYRINSFPVPVLSKSSPPEVPFHSLVHAGAGDFNKAKDSSLQAFGSMVSDSLTV